MFLPIRKNVDGDDFLGLVASVPESSVVGHPQVAPKPVDDSSHGNLNPEFEAAEYTDSGFIFPGLAKVSQMQSGIIQKPATEVSPFHVTPKTQSGGVAGESRASRYQLSRKTVAFPPATREITSRAIMDRKNFSFTQNK